MPRGHYKKRSAAIYQAPSPGSRMLCYIRFSGEDQDSASQEAAMRGWVDKNGWVVHPGDWYKDEARSGSSTDNRLAFAAMIRTAERLAGELPRPAGIAVWRFNRFARDFQDAQFYKAHLRRMGYALVSMADDVPSGDFAPIIESLLDWKAQHDNEQMSQDIRRTFSELRAQGFEPGGRPPRGLLLETVELGVKTNGKTRYGRKWVADPELAPRILEAFTMRASGAGYAAILAGPLHGVYRSASCLPTFFENARYVAAGIVPDDIFRRVRAVAILHTRHEGEGAQRVTGSAFLLSGLLHCGCGAAMVGDSQAGGYRYYRCNRKHRERGQCNFTPNKVPAERIEGPLLDNLLLGIMADSPAIMAAVNAEFTADDGLEAQATDLRQQLAEADAIAARLGAAIERGGSLETLLDRLAAKETERKHLREDLLLLETSIDRRHATMMEAEEVAAVLNDLRGARDAGNVRELRSILKLLISRVVVSGDAVAVQYRPNAEPWLRRA